MKPNKSVILTTAHAFKGLEMDTVYIEDDLNNSANRVIERLRAMENPDFGFSQADLRRALSTEQREDLNTYYVGISRAKSTLINHKYH